MKKKDIKMYGDRVLLIQEAAPDQIKGIIVAQSHAEKHRPARGTIIAVGPKCKEAVLNELVYFGKYAGSGIPVIDGDEFYAGGKKIDIGSAKELLIMREADLFMSV